MSVNGERNLNMVDVSSRIEKDGRVAKIIEMCSETNEIITDMVVKECNDGSKHKTTIRTGLGDPTWRAFYQGVQPTKSTTAPVEDTTGMLEDRSEVDVDLANLGGNPKGVRLTEDRAKIEGMNQEIASTLFYGNAKKNARTFTGLAPRYSFISTDKKKIGYNVIDAGGTGSVKTSVWFCTWGENTMHGIYPKGSVAGLKYQDLGELDCFDEDSAKFRGFASLYKWHLGLCLRDWRSGVRIANIDVSELSDAGEDAFDGANLPNLFIKAYNRQKMRKLGKGVIYCNETVKTACDLIASNKKNTFFTISDGIDGAPITRFRGMPIHEVEGILNTEDRVVAA